ncbi:hypothetical protein [Oceanirhabdus seepicola]|uniref:Uncharacterized protein n=1 Tax=Oceanirhabdus seepicola TaxID=2828781 RepID=A0A9J6NYT6_9CLOT|nr:hypothetical protein [Oceanirhabdus seepicola]MCM1989602.1 hypothetical protein [Oceanirhabdus seepicola]
MNIIKAVNNSRFVSKKDERYYEIGYGCKRIYTDEKLDIPVEKNIVYNIQTKSGQSFEVVIVDSGKDDLGEFIVLDPTERYWEDEESTFTTNRVAKGIGTIRKIFSPYDIDGGKELVEAINGWWPDFHDVEFIVNREANDITMNIKNVLFYEINLKMINVLDEKFVGEECTGFESFYNNKINNIEINRDERGMYKIVVENSYKEYIPKERNEEGVPIEYAMEKHIKEGIILCEDIKLDHHNGFLRTLRDKGITYTEIKEGDIRDLKTEMDKGFYKRRRYKKYIS